DYRRSRAFRSRAFIRTARANLQSPGPGWLLRLGSVHCNVSNQATSARLVCHFQLPFMLAHGCNFGSSRKADGLQEPLVAVTIEPQIAAIIARLVGAGCEHEDLGCIGAQGNDAPVAIDFHAVIPCR